MRTVLVVTDSDCLEPILRKYLSRDYSLTFCRTAEEALFLLPQGFDGLILDLFLPGTDGLTLLRQIRGDGPPVILVLTRLVSASLLQELEGLSVGCVILVPCTISLIRDRLDGLFL